MNRKLSLLALFTILVMTFGLLRPSVARAEDETPPDPAVTEPVDVTEEPVTVPEILEQAPEGTEIVVVNAEGEAEPLATQAAVEIIANSDPVWCPEGQTPITDTDPVTAGYQNGCTAGQATVDDLIDVLTGDPVTYSGNGIIYFQEGDYTSTETSLLFDNDVLSGLGNVTLWGGWDLDTGSATYGTQMGSYATVFNVPITVTWSNNVTLYDLIIEDVTGNGLVVETTGNIAVDDLAVAGSTLTGAYLDTCIYDPVTGLCAGEGTVSVANATFAENDGTGLAIDSGGDVTLSNVDAVDNGLNGATIQSADEDGAGNVLVEDSTFVSQDNGTGLYVYTGGTITLDGVDAVENNTGAQLYTTYGDTGGAISVTDSMFFLNDMTGLHAESNAGITLEGVSANDNGANGAYLIAGGDVLIVDSVFNANVKHYFPEDPGLYVDSQGTITLTDVEASDNVYGAGAVLVAHGGDIIVQTVGGTGITQSVFNGNGTFGIQISNDGGDITLNGVYADSNAIKGAYLFADSTSTEIGNIFIYDSVFSQNGTYGIYAQTSEGNITLDGVTVNGTDGTPVEPEDNVTNIGAFLSTWSGGDIFVTESTFADMTQDGLMMVGSDEITLLDMVADGNGENGVTIYSTYTFGCRCPDETPVDITVNVDGGEFTDNGGYGLWAMPGPAGEVIFVDPATTAASVFSGNGTGDYLVNNDDPEACTDLCLCQPCGCDDENPTEPKKQPQVIEVPFKDGEPVLQDCENFTGTVLQLPDGSWVKFGCPFTGYTIIEGLNKEDLPGELGAGITFLAGIDARMYAEDGVTPILVNPDGSLVISFNLPTDQRIRSTTILYWDPTANDGAGTWIAMPPYEVGTSYPLHPEDPEDQRLILSGVKQDGGKLTLTVNFPGVFILVTP